MNQLVSPDWPAYYCYLIVVFIGGWTAASFINRLLDSSTDRWAFAGTWSLFLAHVGVPLGLFWFLDYTNALHDTSLFAAITVAIAYRQIFAGGVQGILMPGQTPALWKPFEAWVARVSERIRQQNILWLERFNEKLKDYLSTDAGRLNELQKFAFKYSKDVNRLDTALQALAQQARPQNIPQADWQEIQAGNKTRLLIQEVRTAVPQNYGFFLVKDRLLTPRQYRQWLGNARATFTAWIVGLLLLSVPVTAWITFQNSQCIQFHYYSWRFCKPNATEADRFRSQEYMRRLLAQTNGSNEVAKALLRPLLKQLRYKAVSVDLAKNIAQMVTISHSPALDESVIPELIEAVGTDNANVRLVVNQLLKDLQAADSPKSPLPQGLSDWQPQHEAPPGEIDSHVRAWRQWWQDAHK